jgi:hypothetical protein
MEECREEKGREMETKEHKSRSHTTEGNVLGKKGKDLQFSSSFTWRKKNDNIDGNLKPPNPIVNLTSGYVNVNAKDGGIPISLTAKYGSGDMTDRHAKLTLFPIIFWRNMPSFFSSN